MTSPTTSPQAPTVPKDTVRQVAQMLGKSERSVYRLAATGAIPSYKLGGELRFDLAEVANSVRATRRSA